MAKDKGKKKLGMTTLIFIGLFLGAFTGIILYYFVPSGYVRDTVLVDGIFYVGGRGSYDSCRCWLYLLYSVH